MNIPIQIEGMAPAEFLIAAPHGVNVWLDSALEHVEDLLIENSELQALLDEARECSDGYSNRDW